MTDILQEEVERLAQGNAPSGVEDYDEVLTPLAKEVVRRRRLHDAIRDDLAQLEAFCRGGESRNRFPRTAEAIDRVLAAWRAAEPQ